MRNVPVKINPEPDVAWLEGYDVVHLWPVGVLMHPSARQCAPEDVRVLNERTGEVTRLEAMLMPRRRSETMLEGIARVTREAYRGRGVNGSPLPPQRWFDEQAMIAAGLTAEDLK